ncbi:MAG: hypothetical protein GY855_00380 [candidate division Zixibacteria bacterium]|nr:hypothetical protein [candidate division Zixibacteria bacterium]
MIPQVEYLLVDDIEKALSYLSSDRKVIPFAGGTDLLIELRKRKNPFESVILIDTKNLGIDRIKSEEESVVIGASATHSSIEDDELIKTKLPVLSCAASQIGSKQIRNRGTIGGNIINAAPCADSVPALLLYNTNVVLKSYQKERTISLAELITGPYRTLREDNELLTEIRTFPVDPKSGWSYFKLGRRNAVNISRMTVACLISIGDDGNISDARIAAGSVFPITSRILKVEQFLYGEKPSKQVFIQAGKIASEQMIEITGNRWSTPFKKPVLENLIYCCLNEAFNRCEK